MLWTVKFIPSVLGHDISPLEWDLFSLPVWYGGLSIWNPTTTTDLLYSTSKCATQLLCDAIKGFCAYSPSDHYDLVLSSRSDYLNHLKVFHNLTYNTLFIQSDSMTQRFMTRNKQSISAWLATLPILKDDFNLSSVELRNALCLRYFKTLLQLPPTLLQLPPMCNGVALLLQLQMPLIVVRVGW